MVRARNLGEADRIVILLTPTRGLVSCVARGARRTSSKTGGHVDLLRHITAHVSEGRSDLHVIGQVETLNAYLGLRRDFERLTLASHFAEMCERFSLPSAANPGIFNLLRQSLTYIETADKSVLPLLRLWHEMTLLSTVGLQPQLQRCVRTGTDIPPGNHWFSASEGGIVKRVDQSKITANMGNTPEPASINEYSSLHDDDDDDSIADNTLSAPLIPAPLNTIKLLRHISRTPNWPRLSTLRATPQDITQALTLTTAMLRYQQERGAGRAERVMREMV